MSSIHRIAVLTSGGDAPGMNAAIRAVVRAGIHRGLDVIGVQRGYSGLILGEFIEMSPHSVSNIIQRGGTILKTARSEEFMTAEGRATAVQQMRTRGIEALVAIGGDGTSRGAVKLQDEHTFPVVILPGTIDNDLYGTDFTIGFDTAVNTAVQAIDKIRDTAEAFERTFYIEVMGRHSGFIAATVGLACGAEFVAIPETPTDLDALGQELAGMRATKRSVIIIVAEGDEEGGALGIATKMKERYGVDYRVCILGHIQRGGAPTVSDRILAARLGSAAVDALVNGKYFVMVGQERNEIVFTPLAECVAKKKSVDLSLLPLIANLAK